MPALVSHPSIALAACPRLGAAARPAVRKAAPRSTRTASGHVARRPLARLPPPAAAADGVDGEMLTPSLSNNPVVRAAAVLAGAAVAAGGVSALAAQSAPAVHLLAWGFQWGMQAYVTFFAGIVMFKNMPRQAFGRVQAKLFPVYFAATAACLVLQAGVLAATVGLAKQQAVTLGVGLAATLANLLIAEPAATKCMFERYALENEAARDEARVTALKKQFGKLHGVSSLFNLVALVACVAHGQWLAGTMALPAGVALLLR